MAELLVTYTSRSEKGMAHGRARLKMNRPAREFTFDEIELIEKTVLEDLLQDEPSADRLFLTNWRWLADDNPEPASVPGGLGT